MQSGILLREKELNPDGTFGKLVIGTFTCATVERPWLDNQNDISCIPEGTYFCKLLPATTNIAAGMTVAYQLMEVPDRTFVEMHVANFPKDVKGCIGLGKYIAEDSDGNRMVTHSIDTVKAFYSYMQGQSFTLEIRRG